MSLMIAPQARCAHPPPRALQLVAQAPSAEAVPVRLASVTPLFGGASWSAPPAWVSAAEPGGGWVEAWELKLAGRALPVLAAFALAGFTGGWWHSWRRS